ncbi:hypothetical protein BT93_L2271 [Corymbia citriodora subsp. variegata]|uniref:non-specific serine/threonine protein kinase n=1 Tax=Corymbia citriodora subsp. variegata TaxID=360336 RepID=A0A8T0CKC1_CORYI|nr:hypothetical protein BT93_L2271 [Corymbia citriodora subsp. variegata]
MEFQYILLLAVSIFTPVIHFAGSATFENISFSFPPFNSSIISREGNATVTEAGKVIQLTLDDRSRQGIAIIGRAKYHQPMHLWDNTTGNVADFSTWFNFTIKSRNASAIHADGMTFFLAPTESQMPEPNYGGGGYLAIVSMPPPSNNSNLVVAVEFDTFNNTWDPTCIHVGIDVNTVVSAKTVCADWMEYYIEQGLQLHAEVTYNSSTQNLSVVLDGGYPNYTSLYQPINLKNYLPEWATFGFSAATGSLSEAHTINAWEFRSSILVPAPVVSVPAPAVSPSPSSPPLPPSKPLPLWAFLVAGTFVLLILVASFALYRYRSKKYRIHRNAEEYDVPAIDEEFEQVSGPKKYSYRELVHATNDFADSLMLGEGGFGRVYEGYLSDANSRVAIKKIRAESKQGIKEYATEVKIISQLRHKNLVQLVGWCHEKKELLLVYELMPNGSLDTHLFNSEAFLTWEKRYKIAEDIASALLYLHEGWMECVIHRDIKPSNIMLDSDSTAKLGDFGLARLADRAKGSQTTIPAGTVGYMPPECIYTSRVSKESDMYSFGAVLLEIACGRRLIEPREEGRETQLMMQWVWELYGTGKLLHAADPKLGEHFDEKQMECLMIVGLWCTQADPLCRPSIREAINVLNFNAPLPSSLPSQPLVLRLPLYAAPSNVMLAPSLILSYQPTTSGKPSIESSSRSLEDGDIVVLPPQLARVRLSLRLGLRPLPVADPARLRRRLSLLALLRRRTPLPLPLLHLPSRLPVAPLSTLPVPGRPRPPRHHPPEAPYPRRRRRRGPQLLDAAEFREWAVELFAGAVVESAGRAVLTRVPIGVAGIAGLGMATRSGKEVIGSVIGVYALGVATSIYLGLSEFSIPIAGNSMWLPFLTNLTSRLCPRVGMELSKI